MAKSVEKMKALRLRRAGKSIRTIAQALGVSRGSVSEWCQEVVLTPAQREKLTQNQIQAGHRGRIIGAEMNRKKKLDSVAQQESLANASVGDLSARDMLMLGIGLYWGEGVKGRNASSTLTNSDPQTILFAKKWFIQFGVSEDRFRPYIFISEIHRPRERKIISFWSSYLGIPKSQFGNVIFLKGRPKKIYENYDSYYGVLALRVRRATNLKYHILGLIKACKREAGVAQLVVAPHS